MSYFVWTKMQAAGGETLDHILIRKEKERRAGNNEFWWGIGTSLGSAVESIATTKSNHELPVLFSKQISAPKSKDINPASVCVWNEWVSKSGSRGTVPSHVLVTGASQPSDRYYALVCRSDEPIQLYNHGTFDPNLCRTLSGKAPGASQVTCLLDDRGSLQHPSGKYKFGFRAILVRPFAVRLSAGRVLNRKEIDEIRSFQPADDWNELVAKMRCTNN